MNINNNMKEMISKDIEKCKDAINNGGPSDIYEQLLARYKCFDPTIGSKITNYLHVYSNTGYTNELSQLKSILEFYLVSDNISTSFNSCDNHINCNSNDKSPIIFLSHKSDDSKYADALEKFITGLGVKNEQLIYTSHPLHKIPLDENIFDFLRKNICRDIYMIILWSEKYLESTACLMEIGATWIVQCDYTNIYVPNFDFSNPKYCECPLDKNKMGIVLDNDTHIKQDMLTLKNKIQSMFHLENSESEIQYLLDNFIQEIRKVQNDEQTKI